MKKYALAGLIALSALSCQNEKTAFVNTEKVVKDYKEMIDAQAEYEDQSTQMQASLEKEIQTYQQDVQAYQEGMQRMSDSERQKTEQELMAKRQQLQQMQQMTGMQLQQQSQARIDSIIKKVKDYVVEYGEKNGYDYIYGMNEAGSVLYAKDSYDITSEILADLNESYEGAEQPATTPTAETQADTTTAE